MPKWNLQALRAVGMARTPPYAGARTPVPHLKSHSGATGLDHAVGRSRSPQHLARCGLDIGPGANQPDQHAATLCITRAAGPVPPEWHFWVRHRSARTSELCTPTAPAAKSSVAITRHATDQWFICSHQSLSTFVRAKSVYVRVSPCCPLPPAPVGAPS